MLWSMKRRWRMARENGTAAECVGVALVSALLLLGAVAA